MGLKAVVFDFDGTLTKNPIPKFEIMEKSGVEGGLANPEFLKRVFDRAQTEKISAVEALTWAFMDCVRGAGFELNDKNIGLGADKLEYSPGIEGFIEELNRRGVESYIISSGFKAYLEQTKIAPLFTEIYATVLSYNENNVVDGVKLAMSDEQKVEVLREIAERINGDRDDCSGIVYLGDGMTDMPAFDFVKQHGGKTILAYLDLENKDTKAVLAKDVVDAYFPLDYREGSELYRYIL